MSYRVHEFAQLSGVTPKALRHYDRVGLLKPQRTGAGYRVYGEKDFFRLEQIVALKFLGLSLKDIKRVLDRGTPLADALAEQRNVLEEKRNLLDRAVKAIQEVESLIASDKRPDSAILRKLIEVIATQNHVQAMKQYYSAEAWRRLMRMRQQRADVQPDGVSENWTRLFREAESLLTEDPESERAQDFCARWIQLWERTSENDAEVLAGHRRAWEDRSNWPAEIQQQFANFDDRAVGEFIAKAGKKFYAECMKNYYGNEAWSKVAVDSPELAQAWNALYDEIRPLLGENPASEKGRELANKWIELWGRSTQGDPEVAGGLRRAWENRKDWPLPVQRYAARLKMPQIVKWIGKAIAEMKRNTGRGNISPETSG